MHLQNKFVIYALNVIIYFNVKKNKNGKEIYFLVGERNGKIIYYSWSREEKRERSFRLGRLKAKDRKIQVK